MIDRAGRTGGRSEAGSEGELRRRGRHFLLAFSGALRALKLYPVENEQARRALADLADAADDLLAEEGVIDVRAVGDIIFLNGTRLRLDVDHLAAFDLVFALFRDLGAGRMTVEAGFTRFAWQPAILTLFDVVGEAAPPDPALLPGRLAAAGVPSLLFEPETDAERALAEGEPDVAAAKRTYEKTVAVTREIVESIRVGRGLAVKKIKRAVQSIVDQVLNNETSLVGLTTLRDYDEYTFTHSVNVCIFAVALGRRLDLDRGQLYDLGMAALLHDIGKSRVPVEILNKPGGLAEEEWRTLQSHPWQGVLALFAVRSRGDLPYRAMIAAYEHHMKVDLTGYPTSVRPRTPNLFSKIVAVVDGFDAATSRRTYQTVPYRPDEVLKEMWDNPHRGFDRVLVKELINLVGVYPVGTGIILDTREVAVVHAAASSAQHLNRPIVRIVLDADGHALGRGELADLSEVRPDGEFARSIVRVVNLERFGLNPVEYFT